MTMNSQTARGPRKQTLDFLKQFARVYVAAPLGGIVIN